MPMHMSWTDKRRRVSILVTKYKGYHMIPFIFLGLLTMLIDSNIYNHNLYIVLIISYIND